MNWTQSIQLYEYVLDSDSICYENGCETFNKICDVLTANQKETNINKYIYVPYCLEREQLLPVREGNWLTTGSINFRNSFIPG